MQGPRVALPDGGVPIAVAAWNSHAYRPKIGAGARAIVQLPISWDPSSVDDAVLRGHEQFRWFVGGWAVKHRPTHHGGLRRRHQVHHPEGRRGLDPVRPRPGRGGGGRPPVLGVGFTDIALVQIGGDTNDRFLEETAAPLLQRLRAAAPGS